MRTTRNLVEKEREEPKKTGLSPAIVVKGGWAINDFLSTQWARHPLFADKMENLPT